MKEKQRLSRTRIEAIVVLLGVPVYIWKGFQLPSFYRIAGVPGPSVFPMILGVIMGIAALWLLIFPADEQTQIRSHSEQKMWRRLAGRWHFYLMWGLLIGYALFMPGLGFVLSSSILLMALFALLGEGRWYIGAPLAVAFSLAIYFAFAKALQIRLPMGILEGLLR